ncbi:uncharacterized protein LOC133806377 [Humulus lupulus]|uniref:uncharacterized protein LOC133806377 n=1 Tax=Humulus lupulus TaxID=3486 RepID=UPI002B411BB3|nr:uncharacterized protein LOC133806377 [Humulus lupulus]
MKGIKRFCKKGKLSPCYVGPFEISDKVGRLAYRLAWLPALSSTHNVFHISMIRKYVSDLSHVLSFSELELHQNLSYEERPVRIIEKGVRKFRSKSLPLVKVLWSNISEKEATLELEDDIRAQYSELFGKT